MKFLGPLNTKSTLMTLSIKCTERRQPHPDNSELTLLLTSHIIEQQYYNGCYCYNVAKNALRLHGL
jgi:hypothetical protein